MNLPVKKETKDDPTWENVLEILASQNYLGRFYKIPRHELTAMIKIYSPKATRDLSRIFSLIQAGEIAACQSIVDNMSEQLRFVMLSMMVRSMKCWVESESFSPSGLRGVWRVAHS